uniref:Cytochrome P450 n=1 Tax=Psilocybe cubensis TaxID=181762 RepID=A0A8H8CFG5_PSICU
MANMISLAVAFVAAWVIYKLLCFGRREDTLPPGPPTIPILGNAHLLPRKFPFIKLAEMAKDYDGIFSLKVTNGTIVVVSNMKTCKELLDDRSAEFSSRPAFAGMDIVTGGRYFATAPALSFMKYMEVFKKVFSPESAPVDFIPALLYVPERWAPWKKMWKETRELQQSLYFNMFKDVIQGQRNGMYGDCFVAKVIEQQEELGLDQETMAYIGGILLDGGAETTASLIQNLVLCVTKFPAALQKAQMEIDSVVGERLPDFRDIKDLPYVQALIRETHRLLPTAPTAVPHASVNDCEYRGYLIPKNTPVLFNIYGICRDPELYDRPDEFWPDRYLLSPDGTRPGLPESMSGVRATLPFGSGKRICPGMHLANANTNLAIMRLLWAFDFAAADGSLSMTPQLNIEKEHCDIQTTFRE